MRILYFYALLNLAFSALLMARELPQIETRENGKYSVSVPEDPDHYAILYRSLDLKNWSPVDLVPQWWDDRPQRHRQFDPRPNCRLG